MILETIPAIQKLTADQKLLLVTELWQDVSSKGAEASPELAALLEHRVAEYRARPDEVLTTAQLTERVLERKQKRSASKP